MANDKTPKEAKKIRDVFAMDSQPPILARVVVKPEPNKEAPKPKKD